MTFAAVEKAERVLGFRARVPLAEGLRRTVAWYRATPWPASEPARRRLDSMNICVVGTGYVGLVTGACLADFGMDVICVDKDADEDRRAAARRIPIYEPGLEELVAQERAAPGACASRPI